MPRIFGYDISATGDTLYGPFTVLDGQSSSALLTTFAVSGSNNIEINYSIFRNGVNRTGIAMISSNGISSSFSDINTDLADLGVELSSAINGSNIEIRYTSSSTGFNGAFKFFLKRWS